MIEAVSKESFLKLNDADDLICFPVNNDGKNYVGMRQKFRRNEARIMQERGKKCAGMRQEL